MKAPALIGLIVTIVGVTAGATVWFYNEFVTKEVHAKDIVEIKLELAGVSLNQQSIGLERHIQYLKREIRDLEKKYGTDASKMPADKADDYLDLKDQLDAAQKKYDLIQKKLMK